MSKKDKKYNFNETFIDRNIGELCKEYDLIHGASINIARITPDIIDGLKPVQRRALYTMFLKDGGKKFRKLATISGETFGLFHPHCLLGSTEFILTNGTKKAICDMYDEGLNSYEIMSYDPRFNAIVRSILYNVRITKYVREYYEIKFTNGFILRCTDDHPLLIMKPHHKNKYGDDIYQPTFVYAKNLKEYDVLYGGEITNLSFEGNDVGYPEMYIPFENKYHANHGGRKYVIHREFTTDPKLIDLNNRAKWTIHHKNFNKNDFSTTNLVVLDNTEHNLLHIREDENKRNKNIKNLIYGRILLNDNILAKEKILNAKDNTHLNHYAPLFKAFKVLDNIYNDGELLTEENYDRYRLNMYRVSSVEKLYSSGYLEKKSFDCLLEKYNHNTHGRNNSIRSKLNLSLVGSLKSSILKIYSRNICSLKTFKKEDLISGHNKNDKYKNQTWKNAELLGINIDEFLNDLKYSFLQIESIDIIKLKHEVPMYDFTVDNYANGMIYLGSRNETSHSFGFVMNSPTSIEDAIVNMAQEWKNIIPLCDPKGNFGDKSGSEAGASRYIQTRLSDYARDCFFDDWKDSVVDMKLSYNEETSEPIYLPAKYPNILLNGCLGLGYGLATNVMPLNFKELVDATIRLIRDPNASIILIPDSPTGCDIVETDFNKINQTGNGVYKMRCTYEIDDESNIIRITSLPVNISSKSITSKIAEIKEKGGLPELTNMSDLSGIDIDIQFHIRDDVNPYKFIRKLIKEIPGLEKSYPVNITVVQDMNIYDYTPKKVLLEWIDWRREQKRIVITHKRTRLLAEQRTNDVKIFVMDGDNLEDTINIVRSHHNRSDIEKALIERYKDTPIHMDSLQARVLSGMRLYEFSVDERNKCLARREELKKELLEVEEILNSENGIDKVIIAELKDGVKKFGKPRNSSLVPEKISIKTLSDGECILQLSSDGNLKRKLATNIEVPIPEDNNGFAVKVDNDSSFILIDDRGYLSFIKASEIPLDVTVPVSRYANGKINNNIIAMLPYDIDSTVCVTLISTKGTIKKMRIADLGNTKKPCIYLSKDDKLVRGLPTYDHSQLDILVYTKDGMGQRLSPNSIRITSPMAKGGNGFKLNSNDEIIGVYTINPIENAYVLYVTNKGKMRLNALEYIPTRDNKHDSMFRLLPLTGRDKLISIIGCNKLDKLDIYYDNGQKEIIDISKIQESTMSAPPKKYTNNQNAVTTDIVKVELK